MIPLTIDRNIWLRGEGTGVSYLMRPLDKKQCCMGVACLSAGLKPENILGKKTTRQESVAALLPEDWAWMGVSLRSYKPDSWDTDIDRLMIANDDPTLSEHDREVIITERFKNNGVEVTFIN